MSFVQCPPFCKDSGDNKLVGMQRRYGQSVLIKQPNRKVCVRQSTISSSESEDKRQTLMSADYYSGRSTISSRADSGRGWSEGEVPDSDYCSPVSSCSKNFPGSCRCSITRPLPPIPL